MKLFITVLICLGILAGCAATKFSMDTECNCKELKSKTNCAGKEIDITPEI